jgi:GNAT superfamily N-acetyltransferase
MHYLFFAMTARAMMQIQDVKPDDTATLDALMHRVVTTSVRLEKTEMADVLENIRQNLYWAQNNVNSVVHLKCVNDTRIVGIILIKNFWNLCSLFVDPEVQRQGVGRALLTEAIRRCIYRNDRGHVKVISAPNAVQFYQALGFSVIEGHPRRGTSLPMLLHLDS